MKRAIVITLACLGALALVLLLLRFFAGSLSYEKMVRDDFGSPEAIRALATLYERVEKEGRTLEPAGASQRQIPQTWIPKEFLRSWGHYYSDVNQVVAYFDDRGSLVAIEFDGTRCGCYVSRDATRCPGGFGSLHRLATTPLYVTGRVAQNE
jgi:hypothetical protein